MSRIYTLDEAYFHIIDHPNKAYWLGFIAADGNINPEQARLHINLQARDQEHLLSFQHDIGRNAPLGQMLRQQAVRVTICSRRLVADLMSHGITGRKSLTILPWQGPPDLLRHYWRGVFDGDGSISAMTVRAPEKQPYPAWKVSLSGNYMMLEGFRSFVVSNGARSPGSLGRHASIWKISWGGVQTAASVTAILYQPHDRALKRKMWLAEELQQYARQRMTLIGG